jgi:tetratricopeptide (TPR) repeat protein
VWWYTRDSFLYEILNKALREQDIGLLFLFRFVIAHIYEHLKENQCQSRVRVYRGQVMSKDELTNLQRSINQLISNKSFFSTSLKISKALQFVNNPKIPDNLCRVLFDIDADPRVITTKPFADITSVSEFDECEVLFMIGCVFRLIDIRRDVHLKVWVIRMKLCGDRENDFKELFEDMKKEYAGDNKEVTLQSLGDVLLQMGKYKLAKKMYRRLLRELPSNDPSLFTVYYSLGKVMSSRNDYDSSLELFHKSLEIYKQRNGSDYKEIGNIYNSIGEVHRMKGDDDNAALKYYEKAIELFRRAHDENHKDMADFYNNIGIIYSKQGKYLDSLEYYRKSMDIKQKYLPSDHRSLAMSYNNIGCVHHELRQYDLAMEYYERSLKISRKSLPPQHLDIGTCCENIGLVHEGKRQWKQALTCFQEAVTIFRHSLSPGHPDIIQIEKRIQCMSSKVK